MKNLEQQLQKIVYKQKLSKRYPYICSFLNGRNKNEFQKYKEMAKNYAPKYYIGRHPWWTTWTTWKDIDYILAEKYRFLNDLIKLLKTK